MTHLESLNVEQQRAVRRRGDAVVTAGAGAGKTKTLAVRYLDMVIGEGLMPGQILALTFTRKAASEMFERIHRTLMQTEHPNARAALDRFADARIMTLDSFCSLIVRDRAAEFGYPPDFSVDEERCSSLAEKAAFAFVFAHRKDPGLLELLASYPLEDVASRLFADISREKASPVPGSHLGFLEMPDRMRLELERIESHIVNRLDSGARRVAELAVSPDGINRSGKPGKDCLAAVAAFEAWSRDRSCDALLALAMRAYGKDDAQQEVKEIATEARKHLAPRFLETLAARKFLPAYGRLMELLSEFVREVNEAKRAQAVMDYKDLGVCAVHALEQNPELRAWWNSRISSIMIDEFQDDNDLQKRLLYLLTDRPEGANARRDPGSGKLFFVGDEKQSIYRFRGADVSVFRRLASDISAHGPRGEPEDLSLGVNYRSTPALVEFFNDAFARVMDGASEDFEARYSPMSAGRKDPGFPSLIAYRMAEGGGDRNARDRAVAELAASFVHDAVRDGLPVRDGDASRPAGYADFAVLFRSGTRQHLVETALRARGIPFESAEPRSLYSESCAYDLYSALRLALDPSDRPSYAAVLRSPAVGISDDAFVRVMVDPADPFHFSGRLDEDDAHAFARGAALIEGIRARADLVPHAGLAAWIWEEGGYRESMLARLASRPFAEHFDYFHQLAARADAEGKTAWEFVAMLAPRMGSYGKSDLDHVARDSTEGVRLMTVHKSKGLEFPVVIIPWMESSGKPGGENPGIWRPHPAVGVTVDLKAHDDPEAKASNIVVKFAADLEAAKERAELKRLFYVACTRAEDHLLFLGLKPDSADERQASFHTLLVGGNGLPGADGRYPGAPQGLDITIMDIEPDATRLTSTASPKGMTSSAAAQATMPVLSPRPPAQRFGPATVGVTALIRDEGDTTSGTGTNAASASTAEGALSRASPLGADTGMAAADFGTLCHALIAHRIDDQAVPFEPDPRLFRGMEKAAQEKALQAASAAVDRFFASPLWTEIREFGSIRTECGFLLDPGGADLPLVEGRVDLVARNGDDLIIVDFKTDRERLPARHGPQMALYRAAYRTIEPHARVRTILFWLAHGESDEVDADMDMAGLRARVRAYAGTGTNEGGQR